MTHPRNKPYVVILAGGGGTRLWPKSRQNVPKQFLNLFSKKTLLQETYSRVAPLTDNERILIVAPEKFAEEILKELPDLSEKNLIIEPQAKNTAAAMGLACIHIKKRDPEAVVHFLPADHYIIEVDEFQRTLISASVVAEERNDFVVWGIMPGRPATEYGYIHSGDELGEVNRMPVFEVIGFREKPNATQAQGYIATGKYYWNGGKYSQRISVMLDAIQKHLPELHETLVSIEKAIGSAHYHETAVESFAKLESTPIDTGVSEKVKNIVVIPASYTWSDIGSWDALYDISPKDQNENNVLSSQGEYFGYDTHGCLIHTNGKSIATIGVDDMIIIDTDDIIMICPKDRCQDVKKLVEQLKEQQKSEYL